MNTSAALAKMQPPAGAPASAWAARISACWQASVHAILEVGRLLTEAKASLDHGDWGGMVERDLPFGERTAQMLMAIAGDPRLTNPKHVSLLPTSWGTMYELTKLDDATFEAKLGDGSIRPDIERSEVVALRKEAQRAPARRAFNDRVAEGCTVDDLHDLARSGWKGTTIMADPPWLFMTRSAKGQDRSPKYRTDPFADIKALPVKDMTAPNATGLVWCVDWALPEAIALLEAWGFTYKTVAFTWAKQLAKGDGWHMGQGYWTRANPEMCLLGTKGSPTRLNADVRQLIVSPLMEHSRKPDEVHDRVERLVGGPYLELYARRVRAGWKCWGNEIARRAFEEGGDDTIDASTGEITESASPCSAGPMIAAADTQTQCQPESSLSEHDVPPSVVEPGPVPQPPSPAGAGSLSYSDIDLTLPNFLVRKSEGQEGRV